jgi:hypothetical protein
MARDFYIELSAPDGLRCLAPLLGQAPVDLEIGHEDGIEPEVLIQASVSRVAGFPCEGAEGAVRTYGLWLHERSLHEPLTIEVEENGLRSKNQTGEGLTPWQHICICFLSRTH